MAQASKRPLEGKRIAIVAMDGFEEIELVAPRTALIDAGAKTVVVSPKMGVIYGMKHHDKAGLVPVELGITGANADDFDALLLPGGALNADQLRADPHAIKLVRAFATSGKPIAAICHAPWLLLEADVIQGKKITSWPSLKTDLTNAGAEWADSEVIVDGPLVTSRKPADIPAFNAKMIEVFAQGTQAPWVPRDREAARPGKGMHANGPGR